MPEDGLNWDGEPFHEDVKTIYTILVLWCLAAVVMNLSKAKVPK